MVHDLELELSSDSALQASYVALDNALGWPFTAHKTGKMYSVASQEEFGHDGFKSPRGHFIKFHIFGEDFLTWHCTNSQSCLGGRLSCHMK